MGDVAMSIPVVYAFARVHPDLKITFLSKPFFKPIVKSLPNVTFVAAEVTTVHKGVSGIWKLSRDLKKRGITHVADLHNVLRSKMLRAFLSLPSASLDKGRQEKKALTRSKDKIFKPLPTTILRYTSVFKALGFQEFSTITLPKPMEMEAVQQFVLGCKEKWIGVAPFAAHKGKQYPLDLMRAIIKQLDSVERYTIFLFGAPTEASILKELSQSCSSTKVVADTLTFNQNINLISQLDVMLSMDSGNAHLAAMYGVPTVTLWGVTHPYAGFAPFNQEAHCLLSDRKLYPAIPTSVYGNEVPEGYQEVMRTIIPEEVVAKIQKLA